MDQCSFHKGFHKETLGEPLLDIGDVVGEVSTAFSGSDESDDGDAPAAGTGLAL